MHQGTPEHPERVANCQEDAAACRYMKSMAHAGKIAYYECGAIGQHGIVSGSPKGKEYFDQFRTSRLGTLFVEGKYVNNCVDHSDSATYWVLLGEYGVSLQDIGGDGTNLPKVEKANETKFAGQRVVRNVTIDGLTIDLQGKIYNATSGIWQPIGLMSVKPAQCTLNLAVKRAKIGDLPLGVNAAKGSVRIE